MNDLETMAVKLACVTVEWLILHKVRHWDQEAVEKLSVCEDVLREADRVGNAADSVAVGELRRLLEKVR